MFALGKNFERLKSRGDVGEEIWRVSRTTSTYFVPSIRPSFQFFSIVPISILSRKN